MFPLTYSISLIISVSDYGPISEISFRDHSQTLVRRGLMQKKKIIPKIFAPLLQNSKYFRAPFFAMKITSQTHRKACKLNFLLENLWYFFFKAPFTRVNNFKGPLFASGLPNKCLWTVPWCIQEWIKCRSGEHRSQEIARKLRKSSHWCYLDRKRSFHFKPCSWGRNHFMHPWMHHISDVNRKRQTYVPLYMVIKLHHKFKYRISPNKYIQMLLK